MSATAIPWNGRPPRGDGLWDRIIAFVERNDPRTTRGVVLYGVLGVGIGIFLGRFV